MSTRPFWRSGTLWRRPLTRDPQALARAAQQLGAAPIAWGDVGFSLEIMDGLAIGVQFWQSDEDFPAQIRWFWDKNALDYLRYETMYYAVSLVRQGLGRPLPPRQQNILEMSFVENQYIRKS